MGQFNLDMLDEVRNKVKNRAQMITEIEIYLATQQAMAEEHHLDHDDDMGWTMGDLTAAAAASGERPTQP